MLKEKTFMQLLNRYVIYIGNFNLLGKKLKHMLKDLKKIFMNMNPAKYRMYTDKITSKCILKRLFITNVVCKGIRIGNEEWSIYYCISLMSKANCNKNVFAPIFNAYIMSILAKRHPHLPTMCFYIYFIISRHAIIRFNGRYVQQKFFF